MSRVRKSRYWGEMLLSPIHCCDITKPPYLLNGELCTSPLHSNRLFVYTVCCRRGGQGFSVLRTRHTEVVGDSSGRSYVTEQWHNVPLLRTRALCSHYVTRDVTPPFPLPHRKAPWLPWRVVNSVHKEGHEPGLAPCTWFDADDRFGHTCNRELLICEPMFIDAFILVLVCTFHL